MSEPFADVLAVLKTGVSDAILDLQKYQESEPSPTLAAAILELKSNAQFLDQVDGWLATMPEERLREIFHASIKTLCKSFSSLLKSGEVQTVGDSEDTIPAFLVQAMEKLGPQLFVREDKMQVSMLIDPRFGGAWTPEKIEAYLEHEGIIHGVDSKGIQAICSGKPMERAVVVARGTQPVPPKNGYVNYAFDLEVISGKPKVLESGRTDYKELNLFYYVSPGHLLAELVPPRPGVAGSNVFGEEIPPEEGAPAELIPGENTAISEDGTQLTAQVQGYLALDGKVLSVKPCVLIPGDVCYKTGNVNSPIGVTVQGSVLSGFRVYSKETVNVGGLVEASTIISEADLMVNGGVEGGGKGYLEAKGVVRVLFLNEVKVRAGRNVLVAGNIYHSAIWSGGSVLAEGGRATIAQGLICAEDTVEAEEIGSEMGVRTRIELGVATLAIPADLEEMRARLAELDEKRKHFKKAAEKLARLKKNTGSLDAEKEKNLKKTLVAMRKYKQLVAAKKEEIARLEQAYETGMRKMRFVKARKQIWPGTEIRILDTEYIVKRPTGPATITLLDDEIQVLPYSETPRTE